jgi:hypothetical protein
MYTLDNFPIPDGWRVDPKYPNLLQREEDKLYASREYVLYKYYGIITKKSSYADCSKRYC